MRPNPLNRLPRISLGLLLACALACLCLLPPRRGAAQSGVLIPSTSERPDANVLSLSVMNVDVLIDNQQARVRVLQVFDSHVAETLEGKYQFALPVAAAISDFAVWDAGTRVPGVIMERRRAGAVYARIKQQQIDPGLLEQDDEHGGASAFTARVFPVPAYGAKRVELEYAETLPVEGLIARFAFPLRSSSGATQHVGEFNLHLRVLSDAPLADEASSAAYPLTMLKAEAHDYEAEYRGRDLELKDDFAFAYRLDVPRSTLAWTAYRAPEHVSAYDLRDPAALRHDADGYFAARAVFNEAGITTIAATNDAAPDGGDHQPRQLPRERLNVVLLLDTSLSMHGEKLARAVEAVDFLLHGLDARDNFALAVFNDETHAFAAAPLPATPEHIEAALDMIKGSMLGGATDLRAALLKARDLAGQMPVGEPRSVVLITDANPTTGTLATETIARVFAPEGKGRTRLLSSSTSPASQSASASPRARVFAFALGSDANAALLAELARRTHGAFAQARETADITAQLRSFFAGLSRPAIEGLRFDTSDAANFYQVYAARDHSFDGADAHFVGRYRRPAAHAVVSLAGQFGARPISLTREVSLPEFDDEHAQLPRVWARARVDALLQAMNLEGEREDFITEIIRLSQKYKFVTPYTSFVAAPRALLRPRLIQPGDPVLRVKTDASVKAVFAVLPFGETLPLKFLPGEGLWEARFLAPAWMPDGTYRCRLLLTDAAGRGYEEGKSFVIDSHAPRLKVSAPTPHVRAGDVLKLRAETDADAARIVGHFYGAQAAQLFWSPAERANVGALRVPAGLLPGRYTLTVTAEDFAHNESQVELLIEVVR